MLFSDYSEAVVNEGLFNTSKYFSEQGGGEVRLAPAYAQYKLINSLPYNNSAR
jgi:hypothetical protein